jgi:hypothetical protein
MTTFPGSAQAGKRGGQCPSPHTSGNAAILAAPAECISTTKFHNHILTQNHNTLLLSNQRGNARIVTSCHHSYRLRASKSAPDFPLIEKFCIKAASFCYHTSKNHHLMTNVSHGTNISTATCGPEGNTFAVHHFTTTEKMLSPLQTHPHTTVSVYTRPPGYDIEKDLEPWVQLIQQASKSKVNVLEYFYASKDPNDTIAFIEAIGSLKQHGPRFWTLPLDIGFRALPPGTLPSTPALWLQSFFHYSPASGEQPKSNHPPCVQALCPSCVAHAAAASATLVPLNITASVESVRPPGRPPSANDASERHIASDFAFAGAEHTACALPPHKQGEHEQLRREHLNRKYPVKFELPTNPRIAEPYRHLSRHAFHPTSPNGRVLRLATIPRAVWLAACQRQRERRLSREREQREERRWHTRWTYRPPCCRPARPKRPIPKPNIQPGPVALKRRNPLNRSDLQAISRVLNPAVSITTPKAPSRRGYRMRARSARIPPWRRAIPTPARTRRRATPHARSNKSGSCLNWGTPTSPRHLPPQVQSPVKDYGRANALVHRSLRERWKLSPIGITVPGIFSNQMHTNR